jgi:hypothetical protein
MGCSWHRSWSPSRQYVETYSEGVVGMLVCRSCAEGLPPTRAESPPQTGGAGRIAREGGQPQRGVRPGASSVLPATAGF